MTTISLLQVLKGLGACFFTATLALIPAFGSGDLGEEAASDQAAVAAEKSTQHVAEAAGESKYTPYCCPGVPGA